MTEKNIYQKLYKNLEEYEEAVKSFQFLSPIYYTDVYCMHGNKFIFKYLQFVNPQISLFLRWRVF